MRILSIALACSLVLWSVPSHAAGKKKKHKTQTTETATEPAATTAAPASAQPAPQAAPAEQPAPTGQPAAAPAATAAPAPAAPTATPTPAAAPAPTPQATVDAAFADLPEQDPDKVDLATLAPHSVLLSLRAGPSFPGLYNKLKTTGAGEVEASYQLPWRDHALGIFLGLGYTQPTLTGAATDARVATNGGAESYSLTVRDFGISLGAQYLFALPKHFLVYVGAGVELHLTRSTLSQQAGTTNLGYTYEDATRFGPLVRLGAGYALGPGFVCLELRQEYTGTAQLLPGLSNTASLSTEVGYTFRL